MNHIKTYVKENRIFILFWIMMFFYYTWRLFGINMLYDELYTGRSFIYRGIIYCITDWREPNNHILYSELSWIMSKLGNKYIGIRGISFLAANSNLILLYELMKKICSYKKEILSLCTTMIYSSFYMVIYQSVQGRGYTLSISIFLISLHLLLYICTKDKVSFGIMAAYAVLLALSLYTVTVNLYLVAILSLTGGLTLLMMKEYKKLWRLIKFSLVGAILTFLLYLPTILGMGMMTVLRKINHIGEREAIHGLGFKAMIQTVIFHPVDCFIQGVQAMTGNHFLVKRSMQYMIMHHGAYLKEVMQNFTYLGVVFNAVIVCSIVTLGVYEICGIFRLKNKKEVVSKTRLFALLLVMISVLVLFFMPLIQRMVTPTRTFTYIGVPIAIGIGLLLEKAARKSAKIPQIKKKKFEKTIIGVFAIYLGIILFMPASIQVCAKNERETYEILKKTDGMIYDRMLIGTIFGKGQIWFETGREVEDRSIEPEYVLLLKEQLDPKVTEEVYQAQGTYEDMPWEWINKKMQQVYEDEKFVAYKLK